MRDFKSLKIEINRDASGEGYVTNVDCSHAEEINAALDEAAALASPAPVWIVTVDSGDGEDFSFHASVFANEAAARKYAAEREVPGASSSNVEGPIIPSANPPD